MCMGMVRVLIRIYTLVHVHIPLHRVTPRGWTSPQSEKHNDRRSRYVCVCVCVCVRCGYLSMCVGLNAHCICVYDVFMYTHAHIHTYTQDMNMLDERVYEHALHVYETEHLPKHPMCAGRATVIADDARWW
jgi:hypothetical protein